MLLVELEARRAHAGVAACSVDTDAAALTDSGFQLTFVYVCKRKYRVMDASSSGQPSGLGVSHISWHGSIWKVPLSPPSRVAYG